jgi:lipopolysaccharide transport system permease protein
MRHQRVITAEPIGTVEYVKRVWDYRSLLRLLAVRDIKIRYSQTLLGVFWSVLQPMVAVVIYTVFFYHVLGVSTGDTPYPVFVLPGIIVWFQFTNIIGTAGTSLMSSPDLIRKVEFPKLVLPLSKVLAGLLEVGITVALMFVIMMYYGVDFSLRIILLPLFMLMNALSGLSIAIWLAALTIRYRDLHHIIPYLISFGIWITPVFYPTTILPPSIEDMMYFNPVAMTIALMRWCVFGLPLPSWYLFVGFVPLIFLLATGWLYFVRVERTIVDHV